MIDTTLTYAFSYLNVSIIKPWNYSNIKLSILISVISTQKRVQNQALRNRQGRSLYLCWISQTLNPTVIHSS